MPQLDERLLYDNLTDLTRRDMHRADEAGYDVQIRLHPEGVEITLLPRTKEARVRLALRGFAGRAIRATAPFVELDPSVDCIAIESAVHEAMVLHDQRLAT